MLVIWSHESDSQLGITPVVSGARMLTYGSARPKRPPHVKEVQYKGTDRPNEGSITLCDHQSLPGVRGRDVRGRPSGPVLFILFSSRLVAHSSRYNYSSYTLDSRSKRFITTETSSGLELATVLMYRANDWSVSLSAPCRGRHYRYNVWPRHAHIGIY